MTTKEVAQICGVSEKTVYNNASKANVVLEHGKAKDWTEDEVKKLQMVLMQNAQNAGGQKTEGSLVKATVESSFQSGLTLQELIRSGNVDAMVEFNQMCLEAVKETARNKQLEAQNQLLLEQKEKAEAETERIYQVNRNFHENLYTATEIGKKLGISANQVGRIANELNLKQDPIWGKLGKVQLPNGKWINQFYYNESALTAIEATL